MHLLTFLIIFPLATAFILLFLKNYKIRAIAISTAAALLSAGSIALLIINFHRDVQYFSLEAFYIDKAIFFIEVLLAVYIFYISWKYKKYIVSGLILAQFLIMAFFELKCAQGVIVDHELFVDKFSIIMALIIGVVGSLICVYAIGYMKDFHLQHHKALKDNRCFFSFLMFVFLSAMFGIVFSNNLLWLYFFWEITTICSFLLIGYKKTEEAINNAFRALQINLLGGLAFLIGIIYLYYSYNVIELDKAVYLGKLGVLIPVALISFAGLTKSAQMPFSSWLLGAMVAPTPVSALLHSSTMVKAGVYIILRFAFVLQGTMLGFIIALIGGVTFLITSLIAISQSDAKKALAYSTIANLGLIVLCAGVGTYEAMWAAMLLIIFHAVTKCLLFLCVGAIEHRIHSRDIEDMSGLIISMPKISIMIQIGMVGMFLAPFGMLISKWAVLKALVDFNPLLAVFVIFGSSATLFFWVKWLGKIITVVNMEYDLEQGMHKTETAPLFILAFLTVGLCSLFPFVSTALIQPYVMEIYGMTLTMSHGNIVIMSIMLAMVMLFPLSFINYGKRVKVVDAYLAGANTETSIRFRGAAGSVKDMQMKNYYLEKYFGEAKLYKFGALICFIFIIFIFISLIK
ncbi:MAG: proton-conducting transporter membrane subunit [Candidatus Omnitrophica bacterium]|nr:proton-conducting transporter membrane subunit [Candidatus Omnitrophota bacterium]